MTTQYNNHTIAECDRTLAKHEAAIRSGRMTFWQKFTCDKCWQRIQVDEPNKLFTEGHCQHCGHVTDLTVTGCNYSILVSGS